MMIYRVEGHTFPLQHQRLGMSLGLSKNTRSAMAPWVLIGTGDIMHIQTMRQLLSDKGINQVMIKQIKDFD